MRVACVMLIVAAVSACGAPDDVFDDAPDGPDTEDAPVDETRDVVTDTFEASVDAPIDVVTRDQTAIDAPREVSVDRASDVSVDRASDVSVDRGYDAGLLDAPRDVASGRCPSEMTLVEGRVCVDRWEGALEELGLDGGVSAWSPYLNPGTRRVRAVSRAGAVPQGYITGAQAQTACMAAGKRLCALDEWLAACRGPANRTYPYGNTYVRRRCNEGRSVHPVVQFFGTSMGVFTSENMNNPGINMQADTVAPTGSFADCVSPVGAFDMVGNLHEWISDPAGTFKGGFYVDAERNGPGCLYTTTAHTFTYRDYSTGFRCCASPR